MTSTCHNLSLARVRQKEASPPFSTLSEDACVAHARGTSCDKPSNGRLYGEPPVASTLCLWMPYAVRTFDGALAEELSVLLRLMRRRQSAPKLHGMSAMVREIGIYFDDCGGLSAMMFAHEWVAKGFEEDATTLSDLWHGIGSWRSRPSSETDAWQLVRKARATRLTSNGVDHE